MNDRGLCLVIALSTLSLAGCLGETAPRADEEEGLERFTFREDSWNILSMTVPEDRSFDLIAWSRAYYDRSGIGDTPPEDRVFENQHILFLFREAPAQWWNGQSNTHEYAMADHEEARVSVGVGDLTVSDRVEPVFQRAEGHGRSSSTLNLNNTRLHTGTYHLIVSASHKQMEYITQIDVPSWVDVVVRNGNQQASVYTVEDFRSGPHASASVRYYGGSTDESRAESAILARETHNLTLLTISDHFHTSASGRIEFSFDSPIGSSPSTVRERTPEGTVPEVEPWTEGTLWRWGAFGPPGQYQVNLEHLECSGEGYGDCPPRVFIHEFPVPLDLWKGTG